MNRDLETMLRTSLQQRAEDVEPTPELWRSVERKVARRRVLPLFVWTAAGVATAVTAFAVVPALLDGVEDRFVIEPGEQATVTGTEEAPEAQVDGAAGVTPTHYVAAVDGRLVLRTADADGPETVLVEMPAEGGSRVATFAVRPGSSPDDLTVAFVTAAEGMYDLRLYESGSGAAAEVVAENLSPGAPGGPEDAPTPVWSPDGSTIGWAGRGPEGDALLHLVERRPSRTENTTFTLTGTSGEARLRLQDCAVSAGTCGALRLQDWAGQPDDGRLSFTSEGLLLETGIARVDGEWTLARDGELEEVDPDRFVVDVATGADDTRYELIAAGSDSRDAEDAGLRLSVGDDAAVGFPDLATAAPAGAWMTAVEGGAIVGLGRDARLVTRVADGLVSAPATGTSYAMWVPVPASNGPDTEPGPSTAGSEAATGVALGDHLAVDAAGRVLLRAGGDDQEVLYPDGAVSPEAVVAVRDVSVRPGSTADVLAAVLLQATEGGPELVALSHAGGETTTTRMEGPYGVGADADLGALRAPIWSPDGDHLAWVERSGDGSWTLRTVGWAGGPGTGRTADDQAAFGVDLSTGDLAVVDWIWADEADGQRTGAIFLVARGDADAGEATGIYRVDVERQVDGALAVASGPRDVPADVDEGEVLGARMGEASGTRLVVLDDGSVAVRFGPDEPIVLDAFTTSPVGSLRLSGNVGEPVVSDGDRAVRVLADGRVETLGDLVDVSFLTVP